MTLFNEDHLVPKQASSRIQRWAWKLAAYEYTIAFRKSKQHANADALSRLPLKEMPEIVSDLPEIVLMMNDLNDSPISAKDISDLTKRDPVLSRVYKFTQEGWPGTCDDEQLKPFEHRKSEFSTQDGCLIWGTQGNTPPSAETYFGRIAHRTPWCKQDESSGPKHRVVARFGSGYPRQS